MKSRLKYVAVAVVLAFWAAYVYQNWDSFAAISWRLDPALLVAGFVFYTAFYLVMGAGWVLSLKALGRKVNFAAALRIWIVSTPARYLPGKVWHIAGRAYMGAEIGISKQDLLVSSFLEHALAVVGGLIVFLVFAPIGGAVLDRSNLYFLVLIPVGLALTHPLVLRKLLGLASRVLHKGPVEIDLAFSRVLGLLVWFAFSHILSGISLFLVLAAITPTPLSLLPAIVGISAFAWVLGLVTLITPGGIGVRETTIVLLGSALAAVPAISAAAFVTRFISVISEACLVAASTVLLGREKEVEARERGL